MPARKSASVAGPSTAPPDASSLADPDPDTTPRRPRRSRGAPKRIYEDAFLSGAAELDDDDLELTSAREEPNARRRAADDSDSEDEWRPGKGKGKQAEGGEADEDEDDDDDDAAMDEAEEQEEDDAAPQEEEDDDDDDPAAKPGRRRKAYVRTRLPARRAPTKVKPPPAAPSYLAAAAQGKGTRPSTRLDSKISLTKRDYEAFWRPPKQWRIVESAWPDADEAPVLEPMTEDDVMLETFRTDRRRLPYTSDLHDHAWWPGRRFSAEEDRQRAEEWLAADDIKRAAMSREAGAPFDVEMSFEVVEDSSAFTTAPGEDDYPALHADMPDVSAAIARLTTDGDEEPAEEDVKFVNLVELPPAMDGDRIKLLAGPVGKELELDIGKGEAIDLNLLHQDDRHSHVAFAGGHIYSVAWRPLPLHALVGKEYLAVSASSARHPRTSIGSRVPRPYNAALQIWSVDAAEEEGGSMSVGLEMYACHELGSAWQVEWCPTGHDLRNEPDDDKGPRRLGLLAGAFQTGVVAIFAIPHPDDVKDGDETGPISVSLTPTVELSLHGSALPYRLTWAGGERLAVGCSNGFIAIYNMREILSSGVSTAPPSHLFPTQGSPVTSITWLMHPKRSTAEDDLPNDAFLHDEPPNVLIYSNLSGEMADVDIDQPQIQETMYHARYPCLSTSFLSYMGFFVSDRDENGTRFISNRPESWGGKTLISRHMGVVTTLQCSPHHLWLAAGAQDGAVRLSDMRFGVLRKQAKASTALFRLDIDRSKGTLRMLDDLLPVSLTEEDARGAPVTWHPTLCVTDVAWSPNFSRGLLLASATASGLLRLDWCEHKVDGKRLGGARSAGMDVDV